MQSHEHRPLTALLLAGIALALAVQPGRHHAVAASGGILAGPKKIDVGETPVGNRSFAEMEVQNSAGHANTFTAQLEGAPDVWIVKESVQQELKIVTFPFQFTTSAHSKKYFLIEFRPTQKGAAKAKLVFQNAAGLTELSVGLKGQGKPCPPPKNPGPQETGQCPAGVLEVLDPVYPALLAFGETPAEAPVRKSVRLMNKSHRTLRLSVSDPRAPFYAPRTFRAPPGESNVPVTFNPSGAAPLDTDMLGLLTLRTSGKSATTVQAFLLGRRNDRKDWLEVSPARLELTLGPPDPFTRGIVRLTNHDAVDHLVDAQVTDIFAFSVEGVSPLNAWIPAGGTIEVKVRFFVDYVNNPPGSRDASLWIKDQLGEPVPGRLVGEVELHGSWSN